MTAIVFRKHSVGRLVGFDVVKPASGLSGVNGEAVGRSADEGLHSRDFGVVLRRRFRLALLPRLFRALNRESLQIHQFFWVLGKQGQLQ